MCCNNFGYFTNILSQMMLPMMMMRSMSYGGGYMGGLMGGYTPSSIFMQPYSSMPIMPNYSFMPSFSYMPLSYTPMMNFFPTLNYTSPFGGAYSSKADEYLKTLGLLSPSKPLLEGKEEVHYVNTDENGVKRNPFEAFEKMEDIASSLDFNEAKNYTNKSAGVQITDDAWRADAEAKKADVESNYMTQVKAFGKEFIKGIDKKHGNADGTLTYEEFEKYQLEDLPADADAETKKAMKESVKFAFDRLNINGGETIDEKEITALLAAMDYDKDSNVNGVITIDDFTRISVQLANEGKNSLDELLKNRYDAFFDTNA